jgi:hypothetical protein
MQSVFIRDESILSSERKLYKDHDSKGPVAKSSLIVILKGLGAMTK